MDGIDNNKSMISWRKVPKAKLPTYLVIGASSSGKTSLIAHSDLYFPQMLQPEIESLTTSTTTDCSYWTTTNAILLDTCGRYTDDKTCRSEWLSLLAVLKNRFSCRALQGIIVTISIDSISFDDEDHINLTKLLYNQIQDIYQRFRRVIPVFIVFTHIDHLPGFNDFFPESSVECEQIWGCTLLPEQNATYFKKQIDDKLQQFYQQLARMRFHKIATKDSTVNKFLLYDFPEQFNALSAKLSQCLTLLMTKHLRKCAIPIVGLYFNSSSSHQSDKNYFTNTLFTDHIFKFKQIKLKPFATINQYHTTILFFSLIVTCLLCLFLSISFTNNRLFVNRGSLIAHQLIAAQAPLKPNSALLLTRFNSAFDYYMILLNKQHSMVFNFLSLYKGNRLIPIYQNLLDQSFKPLFIEPLALEKRLQDYIVQWQNNPEQHNTIWQDYYTTLRYYLLPQAPSPTNEEKILATFWLDRIKINATTIDSSKILLFIHYYLQRLTTSKNRLPLTWSINKDIVTTARQQLNSIWNTTNAYNSFIERGVSRLGYLTLTQLLHNDESTIYQSPERLPLLYTLYGWQSYVYPTLINTPSTYANDWVIGVTNTPTKQQYQSSLKNLYFNAYQQAWYRLICSIQIKPFKSLADAADKLSLLSSPNGPLTQLLQIISQNMRFKTSINLSSPELANYLLELRVLQSEIIALQNSSDRSRAANLYAVKNLTEQLNNTTLAQCILRADDVIRKIPDSTLQPIIKNLLLAPITATWTAVLQTATGDIDNRWRRTVIPVYQNTIANHFPFARTGSDASPEEVARFLQPNNGLLWQFVTTELRPYLTYQNDRWQIHRWLGQGLPVSQTFLNNLTQSKQIADSLFHQNNQSINLFMQVFPIPTPGLSQINLRYNAFNFIYHNGPQEWLDSNWSSQSNDTLAITQLHVVASKLNETNNLIQSGPWSLWHLLALAKLTPLSNEILQASWNFPIAGKSYPVALKFRTGKVNVLTEILIEPWVLSGRVD